MQSSEKPPICQQLAGKQSHLRGHEGQIHAVAPLKQKALSEGCKRLPLVSPSFFLLAASTSFPLQSVQKTKTQPAQVDGVHVRSMMLDERQRAEDEEGGSSRSDGDVGETRRRRKMRRRGGCHITTEEVRVLQQQSSLPALLFLLWIICFCFRYFL